MDGLNWEILIPQLGLSVIFIWLYIDLRAEYRKRIEQHIEDLREIAGLRQNLHRVGTIAAAARLDAPSGGD